MRNRDLTGADERVQQDELFKTRDRMSHHVLPAEKWPLFEIRATRLSAVKIHLHCCLDALIYDAWSAHILLGEWMSFYWEPEQELEPIDISFRDYVLTSRKIGDTAVYDRADAYWQARLPICVMMSLKRAERGRLFNRVNGWLHYWMNCAHPLS